eukprot:Hpha_TRINITY_DN31360_c0_g1::TRINITY_DN31360_c0_g1_i1::g.194429::m.194429
MAESPLGTSSPLPGGAWVSSLTRGTGKATAQSSAERALDDLDRQSKALLRQIADWEDKYAQERQRSEEARLEMERRRASELAQRSDVVAERQREIKLLQEQRFRSEQERKFLTAQLHELRDQTRRERDEVTKEVRGVEEETALLRGRLHSSRRELSLAEEKFRTEVGRREDAERLATSLKERADALVKWNTILSERVQEAHSAVATLPRRGRARSPSYRPSLQSERLRSHLAGECEELRAKYKRELTAYCEDDKGDVGVLERLLVELSTRQQELADLVADDDRTIAAIQRARQKPKIAGMEKHMRTMCISTRLQEEAAVGRLRDLRLAPDNGALRAPVRPT